MSHQRRAPNVDQAFGNGSDASAYCSFFSALSASWAFSTPPTFSISDLAAISASKLNEPPALLVCRASALVPALRLRRRRRNPAAAKVLLTSVLDTVTPSSFRAAMMSRGRTGLPRVRAVRRIISARLGCSAFAAADFLRRGMKSPGDENWASQADDSNLPTSDVQGPRHSHSDSLAEPFFVTENGARIWIHARSKRSAHHANDANLNQPSAGPNAGGGSGRRRAPQEMDRVPAPLRRV
jgi:hypothetical protein